MSDRPKFTSIGGQAVIEGVMMRSPHFVAIAVRKPDGKIALRHEEAVSWSEQYPILKKPILRGVATLLESMVQGMKALGFSAEMASVGETSSTGGPKSTEKLSKSAIAASMAFAFAFGIGLFVALPHLLTTWLTTSAGETANLKSPLFHLVDGGIKMAILLSYVWGISLLDDIYRVFQYHGAEHKTIYAFESGGELSVELARRQSTLHPRCGTSFLLFLVVISVLAFSALFPLLGVQTLFASSVLNHISAVLIKVVLMLPVAGIAYEFIKACAFRMDSPIFRMLIWPGMILQKLTTREPDDAQLEVALVSLKRCLELEGARSASQATPAATIEIGSVSELRPVAATVEQFQEA